MIGGLEIIKQVDNGNITIEPFDAKHAGPNSYDVRLAPLLAIVADNDHGQIDTHAESRIDYIMMEPDGSFILHPGNVYLACSVEKIGSKYFVPTIHGRSTAARHGLMAHLAAGFADVGWEGQIVFELSNLTAYPMRIWPYDRIAQVAFERLEGEAELYSSDYQGQEGLKKAKSLAD